MAPGLSRADQWEAQLLAQILLKARVALFSELDPAGAWRRKCGAGAPTPRLRSSPKGR